MARAKIEIEITDEGRDKGRRFIIEEMPALQAERWALKVIQGATRASGGSVPPSFVVAWAGMAGVFGFLALKALPFHEVEPLLEEMMTCVKRVIPEQPGVIGDLVTSPVEEIATLWRLRKAVWDIHEGNFRAVATSLFPPSEGAAAETTDPT